MPGSGTTKTKLPRQRQHIPTSQRPTKKTKKSSPSAILEAVTNEDTTQILALKTQLRSIKKAVFITGAGISVRAGSKSPYPVFALWLTLEVSDFRTLRKSGQCSFDISVYNNSRDTDCFHTMIRDMWTHSIQAEPTAFHIFMDRFAQDGRLLRHYTQNFDCIEQQLPALDKTTVQLHGRIDQALCQKCGWKGPLVPSWFDGPELPLCRHCCHESLERERTGKRSLGIGRLRPNIVLYGEENPDGCMIGRRVAHDARKGLDVVYVAGTALKVLGARKLTQELCRATKARGGLAVWINEYLPPSGLGFAFDFVLRGDCDEIARSLLDVS